MLGTHPHHALTRLGLTDRGLRPEVGQHRHPERDVPVATPDRLKASCHFLEHVELRGPPCEPLPRPRLSRLAAVVGIERELGPLVLPFVEAGPAHEPAARAVEVDGLPRFSTSVITSNGSGRGSGSQPQAESSGQQKGPAGRSRRGRCCVDTALPSNPTQYPALPAGFAGCAELRGELGEEG
jgi:hypothetical protein